MLVKLKQLLNTYTDEELEDMNLWIDSESNIDAIILDENNIDLITVNTEIRINDKITKERY